MKSKYAINRVSSYKKAIALIDSLRKGTFLELFDLEDAVVLKSCVNYPFRPMPEELIDNVNDFGELVLVNGAIVDPSAKIEPQAIAMLKQNVRFDIQIFCH